MKKHLLFLLVCSPLLLSAQEVTINGLKYYLYADTHKAVLNETEEKECSGELSIPSDILYKGETYTVCSMYCHAFYGCSKLTKVIIPKTVENIVHHYMSDNGNDGEINPSFMNPFIQCTSLETIEVDEENPAMKSVEGVLFSKDGTMLYAYPAGAKSQNYTIPDAATWIGMSAFSGNLYLNNVEMPNTVTRMAEGTFSGCKNLRNVKLSENLPFIDAYTFDNCISLQVLDIPQSVNKFGGSAFRWTNLDALVIRGTFSDNLRKDTFYFAKESMIIYAQPSEIAKFQSVFSGTVLPLNEYYSGIIATHATESSSNLFDLQGRPLSTPPTQGMYIQDGKKVLRK